MSDANPIAAMLSKSLFMYHLPFGIGRLACSPERFNSPAFKLELNLC